MAFASRLMAVRPRRVMLALALGSSALAALPAQAQDAEARLRKIEAEVRALQRQVFPGGEGRFFTPEVTAPGSSGQPTPGTPSASVTTDILGRLDAMEAQLADLTSQIELNSHALTLVQERLTALENERVALAADAAPADPTGFVPAISPGPAVQPAIQPQVPASTSFADGPAPAQPGATTRPAAVPPSAGTAAGARPAVVTPAPAPASAPAAVVRPAAVTPTPAPVQAPAPIAPSADRLAAVQAIAKPQTDDPGDDEYVYGFRLWDAKFFPEAQQQLRLFVGKYPNHKRLTYARNLLGRAYLDEGKPREAAPWFLENYQKDKNGERAPDSLLYLAETMIAVNDTNRACIALAEFADTYPAVATGRLAEQYNADRARVKCN